LGKPAISFEIAEAESESFSDLTEAHTNKLMAIEVEGEILSAPNIMSRLPGQGVLTSNSQDGYTPEELERLLAILQPAPSE